MTLSEETERNGENKPLPVATTPVFYSTLRQTGKTGIAYHVFGFMRVICADVEWMKKRVQGTVIRGQGAQDRSQKSGDSMKRVPAKGFQDLKKFKKLKF